MKWPEYSGSSNWRDAKYLPNFILVWKRLWIWVMQKGFCGNLWCAKYVFYFGIVRVINQWMNRQARGLVECAVRGRKLIGPNAGRFWSFLTRPPKRRIWNRLMKSCKKVWNRLIKMGLRNLAHVRSVWVQKKNAISRSDHLFPDECHDCSCLFMSQCSSVGHGHGLCSTQL